MKNFFGLVIAIPAFIIVMIISGISGCANQNGRIDDMKKYGEQTITVRYYAEFDYLQDGSPDYDHAQVKYARLYKGDEEEYLSVLTKDGYTFNGYYSDPNFSQSSWYADSEGRVVRSLTDADDGVLLYPMFIKN